ncbi:hypothetical protein BCR33DRAFT_717424, partial [Rhizoclosmatium globosum]
MSSSGTAERDDKVAHQTRAADQKKKPIQERLLGKVQAEIPAGPLMIAPNQLNIVSLEPADGDDLLIPAKRSASDEIMMPSLPSKMRLSNETVSAPPPQQPHPQLPPRINNLPQWFTNGVAMQYPTVSHDDWRMIMNECLRLRSLTNSFGGANINIDAPDRESTLVGLVLSEAIQKLQRFVVSQPPPTVLATTSNVQQIKHDPQSDTFVRVNASSITVLKQLVPLIKPETFVPLRFKSDLGVHPSWASRKSVATGKWQEIKDAVHVWPALNERLGSSTSYGSDTLIAISPLTKAVDFPLQLVYLLSTHVTPLEFLTETSHLDKISELRSKVKDFPNIDDAVKLYLQRDKRPFTITTLQQFISGMEKMKGILAVVLWDDYGEICSPDIDSYIHQIHKWFKHNPGLHQKDQFSNFILFHMEHANICAAKNRKLSEVTEDRAALLYQYLPHINTSEAVRHVNFANWQHKYPIPNPPNPNPPNPNPNHIPDPNTQSKNSTVRPKSTNATVYQRLGNNNERAMLFKSMPSFDDN